MPGKYLLRIAAACLMAASLVLFWAHWGGGQGLIDLTQRFFSQDHMLEKQGKLYLAFIAPIYGCIFAGYAMVFIFFSLNKNYDRLRRWLSQLANQIRRLLGRSGHQGIGVLVFWAALGLAIADSLVFMLTRFPLHLTGWEAVYREDGYLENATAVMLLMSSAALIWQAAVCYWSGRRTGSGQGTKAAWFLLGIAGMAFLVGMEEISWGQRIFGWDTPATLRQINLQNETNLHNLVPWLHWAYLGFTVLPVIVLLPIVSPQNRLTRAIPDIVKLHPNLVGLSLVIGLLSLPPFTYPMFGFAELIEELFALLIFIYSFNVVLANKAKPAKVIDGFTENQTMTPQIT